MLTLHENTARELMTRGPVSLEETATVEDAVVFFTDRDFGAAVVIDVAGHALGVVTKTDLLMHVEELVHDDEETPTVRDVMTPAVFSVSEGTTARELIDQMLTLNVHHMFVTDAAGILVGVITPLDIVSKLS